MVAFTTVSLSLPLSSSSLLVIGPSDSVPTPSPSLALRHTPPLDTMTYSLRTFMEASSHLTFIFMPSMHDNTSRRVSIQPIPFISQPQHPPFRLPSTHWTYVPWFSLSCITQPFQFFFLLYHSPSINSRNTHSCCTDDASGLHLIQLPPRHASDMCK